MMTCTLNLAAAAIAAASSMNKHQAQHKSNLERLILSVMVVGLVGCVGWWLLGGGGNLIRQINCKLLLYCVSVSTGIPPGGRPPQGTP